LNLEELFNQRKVWQKCEEIDEEKFSMAYWLPAMILEDEEDIESSERMQSDLDKIRSAYFPLFDLKAEVMAKISTKQSELSSSRRKGKPLIINTVKGTVKSCKCKFFNDL
jgi:hypothetical protein